MSEVQYISCNVTGSVGKVLARPEIQSEAIRNSPDCRTPVLQYNFSRDCSGRINIFGCKIILCCFVLRCCFPRHIMHAGLNAVYFRIKYLTLKTCYRCCKLDRTLIEYSKGHNAYTNFVGYVLVRAPF